MATFIFDTGLLLSTLILLTGGFVWFGESGSPILEFLDPATGIGVGLLALMWGKFTGKEVTATLYKSRALNILGRLWKHLKDVDAFSFQKICYIAIAAYASFYFILILLSHFSLNTGFDTGIFDQVVFNSSRGQFHFSQIKGDVSLFTDHFEPILLLMVPFYWMFSSPIWLYALQVASLLVSSLILLKLAHLKGLSRSYSSLLLLSLLSMALYRGVIVNDFHPISLSAPFMLLLFYCREKKNWLGVFAFSLAMLACKEHMGIYLVAIGLYFIIDGSRKLGFFLSMLGVIAWLFINQFFMPWMGQTETYTYRYPFFIMQNGSLAYPYIDLMEMLRTIFTAKKVKYILYALGPVCFLPLFYPNCFLLLGAFFAQNLLSSFEPQITIGSHYAAEGVAIIYYATIKSLEKRPNFFREKSGKYFFLLCIFLFWRTNDVYKLRKYTSQLDRYDLVQTIKENVSPAESLSLQHNFLPHFSSTQPVYLFPEHNSDVDWIVISNELKPWPLNPVQFEREWSRLIGMEKQYRCITEHDETLLLCKR